MAWVEIAGATTDCEVRVAVLAMGKVGMITPEGCTAFWDTFSDSEMGFGSPGIDTCNQRHPARKQFPRWPKL